MVAPLEHKGKSIGWAITEGLVVGCFKQLPLLGSVADVLETVGDRIEAASLKRRLGELQSQIDDMEVLHGRMSRFSFDMLDLIYKQHEQFVTRLCDASMTREELISHIRSFRDMQRCGWQPMFFEGLALDQHDLKTNPQSCGRVLYPEDKFDSDNFPLLVNLDKPRILEVKPEILTQLVDRTDRGQQPRLILPKESEVLAFVETDDETDLERGKITKLHTRGYGFIEQTVFFHKSLLEGLEFDSLEVGQSVGFHQEEGARGPRATTVKQVD